MKYKKWSLEEKPEILSSSEELRIVEISCKYDLSTGAFYSWKNKAGPSGRSRLKRKLGCS
jgi:putative transposase